MTLWWTISSFVYPSTVQAGVQRWIDRRSSSGDIEHIPLWYLLLHRVELHEPIRPSPQGRVNLHQILFRDTGRERLDMPERMAEFGSRADETVDRIFLDKGNTAY